MDVATNSQRGAGERVREKMLKISEKAKAATDRPAQANERALQERVDAAVREERLRAQETNRRSAKFL